MLLAWFTAALDDIAQFADQVSIRLVPQLITDISSVLRKLLKYFNGTITNNESVVLLPKISTISPLLFKAGLSL